jgi:hypothetical protein
MHETFVKAITHTPARIRIVAEAEAPGTRPWVVYTAIPGCIIKSCSEYNRRIALNIIAQITSGVTYHYIIGSCFINMNEF